MSPNLIKLDVYNLHYITTNVINMIICMYTIVYCILICIDMYNHLFQWSAFGKGAGRFRTTLPLRNHGRFRRFPFRIPTWRRLAASQPLLRRAVSFLGLLDGATPCADLQPVDFNWMAHLVRISWWVFRRPPLFQRELWLMRAGDLGVVKLDVFYFIDLFMGH